jgi:uncharacterized protein YcfJ
MSKSMLVGVVAGVGLATAGGVLGYQFLGQQPNEQGSAEVVVDAPQQQDLVVARVEPTPEPAPVAQVAPQPAPARPAPRPAAQPRAVQPAPAPVAAAAPAPVEECWDEEVTVTEAPKDQHAIAGTAAGAVVGGALGNEISDRDSSKLRCGCRRLHRSPPATPCSRESRGSAHDDDNRASLRAARQRAALEIPRRCNLQRHVEPVHHVRRLLRLFSSIVLLE